MVQTKRLAINSEGMMTYCSVPEELQGVGRCNHIKHQKDGESPAEFIERLSEEDQAIAEDDGSSEADAQLLESSHEISQEQIDDYASKIDEICGVRVTEDNWEEVMSSLPPEKIAEINDICFDAAPKFSLPITAEGYGEAEAENRIYFSQLPARGLAKQSAIMQMFETVGESPVGNGETINIEGNFVEGLTEDEYFSRTLVARDALVSKGVATSAPGYAIADHMKVRVLRRKSK